MIRPSTTQRTVDVDLGDQHLRMQLEHGLLDREQAALGQQLVEVEA